MTNGGRSLLPHTGGLETVSPAVRLHSKDSQGSITKGCRVVGKDHSKPCDNVGYQCRHGTSALDQVCIDDSLTSCRLAMDDSLTSCTTAGDIPYESSLPPMGTMPTHTEQFFILQKQMESHQKSLEEQLTRHQLQLMEAITKLQPSLHHGQQPMFSEQMEMLLQKEERMKDLSSHASSPRLMRGKEAQPNEDNLESTAVQIESGYPSMENNQPDSPKKTAVGRSLTHSTSVSFQAKKRKSYGSRALRIVQRAMGRSDHKDESPHDLDVVEIEGHDHPVIGFFKGEKFDMIIGLMIVCNAIMMSVQVEYEGFNTANTIGIVPDVNSWHKADTCFGAFEHLFSMVFLAEIVIRLATRGKSYLRSPWNWFDIGIVLLSLVDLYILKAMDDNGDATNLSFLRLIRLVKLVKIFRVVRVMRLFHHLRLLVISIHASITALVWSMLLLGLIQLMCSILVSQTLYGWLRDDANDLETRHIVYEHFGTFSRAWVTMFEITLAPGAWGYIGRIMMYKVNRLYFLFFMAYVSFVTFAIIRVITAMFIKETLAAASQDQELVIQEKMEAADRYNASLEKLHQELDTDGDGYVTWDELDTMCQDPRAIAWLHSLDISVQELNALFELMVTGEGRVSWQEFTSGVKRLKGNAKSVDLATLIYENKKVLLKIAEVQSNVNSIAGILGSKWRDARCNTR